MPPDFDPDLVERIAELTRQVRRADGPEADRIERIREGFLDVMDAHVHVREDDTGTVLVVYPADWRAGDTVEPDHIDDPTRAVEVPLEGVAGDDAWSAVMDYNTTIVDQVTERHGPVHGANAEALATYLGNHHLRRIDEVTEEELRDFLDEYYPRNVWPTDEEAAVVRQSVRLTREAADE